ncbi:autotransporter-associated beta strand repeat-containing protein [Oecophyllibacter saccharovorans]|uniref:autotransporter-associated beta strand repeat-containing protein n=2 Tax=Oecophyllibacter saccharovorans TaxID=2558360 RepID=UPI00143DA030|nr:autotransporter-associated beta strand repeat-containing protein [Oecophyllibacter saccharovorans]
MGRELFPRKYHLHLATLLLCSSGLLVPAAARAASDGMGLDDSQVTGQSGVMDLADSTETSAPLTFGAVSYTPGQTTSAGTKLGGTQGNGGGSSYQKTGTGTTTITDAQSYTGAVAGDAFPKGPSDPVPNGSISVENGKLDIGAGGKVSNDGYVIVGRDGNAAGMDIVNGGTLDAKGNVNIGLAGNSNGELTVDGSGSRADVAGSLTVGNGDSSYGSGKGGQGTLNVTNGGQVTAGQVFAGNYAGSTGTVNVGGKGAQLTATQLLAVNGDGNGTVNINDGGTVVSQGVVAFGDGSGQGSGTLNVNAGGKLIAGDSNGQSGIQSTGSAYAMNLNGGTLQVRSGSDLNTSVNMKLTDGSNGASTIDTNGGNAGLSGVLSGSGALDKAGQGTLTLTGDNTYTGNTTVANGTLQLGNGGTTGSIASKNIALASDTSELVINRSNDLAMNQTITGSGGMTKKGAGTTTLTGNVDLEGTSPDGKAWPKDMNAPTPGGSIAVQDGKLDIGAGGHVTNNGYVIIGDGHGNAAGMDIVNGGTLDAKGNVNIGLAGNSNGELTVDGSGSRANVAGSLTVGNGDSSYGSGKGGQGTLNVTNGGQVTAGQVFAGNYAGSTGTVNVGGKGAQLTATQLLAVNGDGNGTVNINDGGTVVSQGVVAFGDGSGQGSGTLNVNAGGKLIAGDSNGQSGIQSTGSAYAMNLNGGTLQVRSGSDLNTSVNMKLTDGSNGASTIDTNGGNAGLSGVLSGSGALDKAGQGTLTLTGDNTYTGNTTVANGTLQLGNGGTTGSIASKNIALASDTSELVINRSNDLAMNQTITGSGGMTKKGAGTTTLTGNVDLEGTSPDGKAWPKDMNAPTPGGSIAVQDGKLDIGAGGHVTNNGYVIIGDGHGNAAGMDIVNGGTLDAKGNVNIGLAGNSNGELTVDGSGSRADVAGSLTVGNGDSSYGSGKGGQGTLNVTNGGQVTAGQVFAGNYAGSTGTVNVGGKGAQLTATQLLAVNGDGNGTVNINDGGTVVSQGVVAFGDGSGQGSGTLNVNAGGKLIAGDSNGQSGIQSTGSAYAMNLNGGTLQVRSGSDLNTSVNMKLTDGSNGASTIDTNGGNAGLSGVLSGSGALDKAGQGTLTLTGDNTYTGNTTVANGTLQLGNGGTTGSIASKNIALASDTSELVINRSNDLAMNQTITGSGGMTKKGAGTTTLTGNVDLEGTSPDGKAWPKDMNAPTPGGSIAVQDGKLDIGAGGHVTNNGYVIIGDGHGNAAGMDIVNGGTLDAKGNVNIGLAGNSNGELTVDGSGSRANVAGSLTVGNGDSSYGSGKGGQGTLNVTNGGQVTAGQVFAGNYAGSTGTVNVGGKGAQLTATQLLAVNGDGNGTVNINDGGTVVSQGVVAFGDGSGQGSGTLNVNAGGKLVAGDSNGQSGIQSTGSAYAMNLNGGTLQVRSGSDLNTSVNMKLTDGSNGASTIDTNGGNAGLSGVLSGSGALDKAGQGTLTLTGDNTYTGNTTVANGTLRVLGSTASSANTTVNQGATLDGTGTIGNATIYGTFAPGLGTSNPYGKMQVNGSAVMKAGSSMVANVGPNLASSQADLTGSFAIDPGATLHVTANDGANLNLGQHYTLVDATGGVSGKFTSYDQSGLIATHSMLEIAGVNYTSNEVQIGLMRNPNASFCIGAGTRNECAAGHGLDGVVGSTGDNALTNIVAGLSNAQRYRALDALSGEIHASARTAMINDSYYIRNTVIDRLDCVDDELRRLSRGQKGRGYCDEGMKYGKINLWGTVYGNQGHNAGSRPAATNAAGLDTSDVGWIMGADTMVGQWRVGGNLAYGRSWFSNGGARDSSTSSNNVTLGAYAGTAWKVGGVNRDAQVTLKLGADYTWNILNSRRTIRFPGYYGHTNGGNLGGTAQVFGESGYKFIVMATRENPVELEPFVRMTWVNYNSSHMNEHGDTLANLRVKGQDTSMGYSTFGLKAATRVKFGAGWISPHVMAAYRYAFGITRGTVRERFGVAGAGVGYDMDVIGTPLSTNTALVEAGVSAKMTDRLDIGLDFIGQYGNRLTTSGGMGHVTYRW